MCLAIPGLVESLSDSEPLTRTGKVRFGGIVKEVNFACLPEARVGDFVLVHVGMALTRIDEAEARRVFSYLEEIGELKAESPP
ncbi:MAG: HypC/HybG/HupF family hydrogenase formation chaperone [Planctomycetota bacterium]|nr:HypC/HybG/HupF family hydrogenase formation chaperone [Planctomycetota bacterium]